MRKEQSNLTIRYMAITDNYRLFKSGSVDLHDSKQSTWWFNFQKYCVYNDIKLLTWGWRTNDNKAMECLDESIEQLHAAMAQVIIDETSMIHRRNIK